MPKLTPPANLTPQELEHYKLRHNICTLEQFFEAVESGDVSRVNRLNFLDEYLKLSKHLQFELNPDWESEEEYTGFVEYDSGNALEIAVSKNHFHMVKYLLENGSNPNSCYADDGFSVLQLATEKGNEKIVRLLLEKGADPTHRDYGRDEEIPLLIAQRNGFQGIEKALKYYYYNYFSEHKKQGSDFFKESAVRAKPVSLPPKDPEMQKFGLRKK